MSEQTVIVGVGPGNAANADAIALGAALARITGSRLALVSAFRPKREAAASARAEHEIALHRTVQRARGWLEGLAVEELVLPGSSAAQVLHRLAEQRPTEAIVLASGRDASPGRVRLGGVSQRLLDGGAAPTAVAPLGFADSEHRLREIGVAYAPGTPESNSALRYAAKLAERTGASLRVLAAYDPADRLLVREHSHSEGELASHAEWVLGAGSARAHPKLTASLLEGDPVGCLTDISNELDLLVIGSHGDQPLHVVLAGETSGPLLHQVGCPLLVVPAAAADRVPVGSGAPE